MLNRNILIKLKQGFYVSKKYLEKETDTESYLEYIGCILKEPSYVSLGYALAKYNLIPESIFDITYVTTKKTDTYITPLKSFIYKSISEKLFIGFQAINYKEKKVYFAYPYKAIFDLFYYADFPNEESIKRYITSSRINWENIDKLNRIELKNLLESSNINKMSLLLQILNKEKIL